MRRKVNFADDYTKLDIFTIFILDIGKEKWVINLMKHKRFVEFKPFFPLEFSFFPLPLRHSMVKRWEGFVEASRLSPIEVEPNVCWVCERAY